VRHVPTTPGLPWHHDRHRRCGRSPRVGGFEAAPRRVGDTRTLLGGGPPVADDRLRILRRDANGFLTARPISRRRGGAAGHHWGTSFSLRPGWARGGGVCLDAHWERTSRRNSPDIPANSISPSSDGSLVVRGTDLGRALYRRGVFGETGPGGGSGLGPKNRDGHGTGTAAGRFAMGTSSVGPDKQIYRRRPNSCGLRSIAKPGPGDQPRPTTTTGGPPDRQLLRRRK